jgi:hypothetical protein
MFIKTVGSYTSFDASPRRIPIRCPACLREGTLDSINLNDVTTQDQRYWFGMRRCPNRSCSIHIFYIHDISSHKIIFYPPERLDFDASEIPEAIKKALIEAISCHSVECYAASALMIRRTIRGALQRPWGWGGKL